LGQGKYAEAEPLILSGYEGLKSREATILPQGRSRLPEAAERVELGQKISGPLVEFRIRRSNACRFWDSPIDYSGTDQDF